MSDSNAWYEECDDSDLIFMCGINSETTQDIFLRYLSWMKKVNEPLVVLAVVCWQQLTQNQERRILMANRWKHSKRKLYLLGTLCHMLLSVLIANTSFLFSLLGQPCRIARRCGKYTSFKKLNVIYYLNKSKAPKHQSCSFSCSRFFLFFGVFWRTMYLSRIVVLP